MLDRLIEDVAEAGTIEFRPKMEGVDLTAVFAPKK
jgi:translation initiation factor IF-3